jgi:hypothetical protein
MYCFHIHLPNSLPESSQTIAMWEWSCFPTFQRLCVPPSSILMMEAEASPKCWITASFSHSWLSEKTSLHSVAMKTSNLTPSRLILESIYFPLLLWIKTHCMHALLSHSLLVSMFLWRLKCMWWGCSHGVSGLSCILYI